MSDANSTIESLENEITDNEEEINGLEGSLADAMSTIEGLEGDLAASRAATEAAIVEGVVNTEEAERVGYSGGFNVGYGEGKGLGLGAGVGLGLLSGQGGGGGGMGSVAPATSFMQDLNTQLTQVQLPQPTQAKDYLAELLARLQA